MVRPFSPAVLYWELRSLVIMFFCLRLSPSMLCGLHLRSPSLQLHETTRTNMERYKSAIKNYTFWSAHVNQSSQLQSHHRYEITLVVLVYVFKKHAYIHHTFIRSKTLSDCLFWWLKDWFRFSEASFCLERADFNLLFAAAA